MATYTINLQLLENNKNLYDNSIAKGNSKKDSGFDLYVPQSVTIEAGEIKLINMRVKCAVTKNTEPSPYYLYARSSVSKRGIILVNSAGIIDCGYRGPLMAAFYNTTDNPVTIEAGDRIVQICMPDLQPFYIQAVDKIEVDSIRGDGGIGSTGL